MHDESLERLFGRPDRVGECTDRELADLGIPSLAAALDALPAPALLDVELKESPLDSFFSDLVRARGQGAEGVVISSFSPDTLRGVARVAPAWPLWLNVESIDAAAQVHDLPCTGIAAALALLSDECLERWRTAGLEIAAWTARTAGEAAWGRDGRLAALCVEGEALASLRATRR